MKKTIALILIGILLLLLVGCRHHYSSYRAIGLVRTNQSTSASMSFYSFEGRMVFKLKSDGEQDLNFSAKLESGSAAVYYEIHGSKEELFSIQGGEEIDSHGGYVEAGTVYITVETGEDWREGYFEFSLSRADEQDTDDQTD